MLAQVVPSSTEIYRGGAELRITPVSFLDHYQASATDSLEIRLGMVITDAFILPGGQPCQGKAVHHHYSQIYRPYPQILAMLHRQQKDHGVADYVEEYPHQLTNIFRWLTENMIA
jgi:hypothetical protein